MVEKIVRSLRLRLWARAAHFVMNNLFIDSISTMTYLNHRMRNIAKERGNEYFLCFLPTEAEIQVADSETEAYLASQFK